MAASNFDDDAASLALALELQRQLDLEAETETAAAWAVTATVAAAADAEDAAAAAWQASLEAGVSLDDIAGDEAAVAWPSLEVLSQNVAEDDDEWEEVLAAVAAADAANAEAEARGPPAIGPRRAPAGAHAIGWEHGSMLEDTGSTFQASRSLEQPLPSPAASSGACKMPLFSLTLPPSAQAHLHAIFDAADVNNLLSALVLDKRVRTAACMPWACHIVADGQPVRVSDDGGEAGASSKVTVKASRSAAQHGMTPPFTACRPSLALVTCAVFPSPMPQLAHLLEMARAENVLVAVSRHVDGPMLGGR